MPLKPVQPHLLSMLVEHIRSPINLRSARLYETSFPRLRRHHLKHSMWKPPLKLLLAVFINLQVSP